MEGESIKTAGRGSRKAERRHMVGVRVQETEGAGRAIGGPHRWHVSRQRNARSRWKVGREGWGGHGLGWQLVNMCPKDQSERRELRTPEEHGLTPRSVSSLEVF